MMKTEGEKRGHHLRVPVRRDEAKEIRALAKAAGLPVAAYLRQLGMGYRPSARLDSGRVAELAAMSTDLARLGGLLHLWLKGDPRTRHVGDETIHAALAKLADTQDAMRAVLKTVTTNPPADRL
jgi:hypothetical protein